MLMALNSLSSAMSSYSMMKTVSSVHDQQENRSNILEAEIKSDKKTGNIEAKKKQLAENEKKAQNTADQLNQDLGKITQEINKPLSAEDKEKLLEEKRAKKKAQEEAAVQQSQKDAQNTAGHTQTTQAGHTGSVTNAAAISTSSVSGLNSDAGADGTVSGAADAASVPGAKAVPGSGTGAAALPGAGGITGSPVNTLLSYDSGGMAVMSSSVGMNINLLV